MRRHWTRDPRATSAEAKKLLADAGYPDGFGFTMDCPNDRYVNDEQVCKMVVTMLSQIGLKATLNSMPRAKFFPKVWERDTSFFMMGLQLALLRRDLRARDDVDDA